jgi:hypothetical protein
LISLQLFIAATKYLREINLKEKKFILSHGFSPWLFGSVAFMPAVRQNSMQKHVTKESSPPYGGQDAISFKGMPVM